MLLCPGYSVSEIVILEFKILFTFSSKTILIDTVFQKTGFLKIYIATALTMKLAYQRFFLKMPAEHQAHTWEGAGFNLDLY